MKLCINCKYLKSSPASDDLHLRCIKQFKPSINPVTGKQISAYDHAGDHWRGYPIVQREKHNPLINFILDTCGEQARWFEQK